MDNPFETLKQDLIVEFKILLDNKYDHSKDDLSNKLYSIRETAKILGCVPATIRSYINKGIIKADKLGRKYLIAHSELYNSNHEVKSLKYKRE